MAVSPTPPSISILPPAPLPTDAEAVFDAKAGVRLTAEEVMVTEQNAALAWQAGSMAETKGYKDAAATSAGAASDSAIAANGFKNAAAQQVGLAADQVALAADQVVLATTQANSAQASAAAAQAAAGLPSLTGNAGKFLGVNPAANGVGWYDIGQKVGDTLMTARVPDASYLSMNGSIYLQSAYPALFALVGLIGGDVGVNWTQTSGGPYTAAIVKIVRGANGTLIAITSVANTVLRSVNNGATWAALTVSVGTVAVDVDCDDNGKWIIQLSSGTPSQRVSTDDGVTWSNLSISGATLSMAFNRYIGNNTWIAGGANRMWKSVDNGATYNILGALAPNTTSIFGTDRNGTCILAIPDGTTVGFFRTIDFFASTTAAPSGGTLNVNLTFIITDKSGTWLTGATSGAVNRSLDNGLTFSAISYGVAIDARSAATDGKGVWIIGGAGGVLRKSKDNMNTWDSITGFNSAMLQTVLITTTLGLVGASVGVNNVIFRSVPFYSYDTATQFKVPLQFNTPVGLNSYIKAKVTP